MIVREHIGFNRGVDPKVAMGTGITLQIEKWLKDYKIERYEIHKKDLMIDVMGEVNLNTVGLFELPDFIRFNEVFGDFHINWNNLSNLKNCPIKIYGSFWANGNPLTSLEGSPVHVSSQYAIAKACGFSEQDVKKACPMIGGGVHLTDLQRESTFDQLKEIRKRHPSS